MLKVVEMGLEMCYNSCAETSETLFLLSQFYTAIIVDIATLVTDTFKSVQGLSNLTNVAIFIGPYTTENAPMIGLASYGAFTKGMAI